MNPMHSLVPRWKLALPLLFTVPLVVALGSKGRAAAAEPKPPLPPAGPRLRAIGVIGGIGPQATMDFEARVHRVAQRRIDAHFNNGYPPLVVYFHRRPPIVVGADGMALEPVRIDPELASAAARIGPMVDFLVITSNGAHKVAPDIERAAGRPVLSMVDRVVDEVRRRGWRRVGVMTLGRPSVYTEPLQALGVACETLPADQQLPLDRAIFGVMEGREDATTKRLAHAALAGLRRRGVDGVILGCTELPFLVEPTGSEVDLINPIELLAEAAVEHAMRPGGSAAVARP